MAALATAFTKDATHMQTLGFLEPGPSSQPSSPKRTREASPPSTSSLPTTLRGSLPPRPCSPLASSTTLAPISQPQQSCALCSTPSPKYTCPRCTMRTCSLACSKAHKAQTGCSGERNKAAYVGLNEYGWRSMMNDYTFLEEVGRKVGEWGKEIVKGGYGGPGSGTGGAEGRGRGRGRGMGMGGRGGRGGMGDRGGKKGGGKTRRDIFKMQMEVRDVDVEFLPLGMMKRKANQSGWDFRKQTGLLTIEFKFHKPRDPLAPSSQPDDPPLTFLTHRSLMNKSLLSILQTFVKERSQAAKSKKSSSNSNSTTSTSADPNNNPNPNTNGSQGKSACPEWLETLILPSPEDPEGFTPPHCVMSAPLDPLAVYTSGFKLKHAFYKLDPNVPLITALKNTQFVEFPTIEVWEEFKGVVVDREGRVRQEEDEGEPVRKRRRLGRKEAKERISGLLGGYGSGEDEEEREEKEKEVKKSGLSLLGEYSESEGEGEEGPDADEDVTMGEDGSQSAVAATAVGGGVEGDGDEDEEEKDMDPAALMELLRQIKGEQWTPPDTGGDDVLEWDDLSDADAEGEDDDPDAYEDIG